MKGDHLVAPSDNFSDTSDVESLKGGGGPEYCSQVNSAISRTSPSSQLSSKLGLSACW